MEGSWGDRRARGRQHCTSLSGFHLSCGPRTPLCLHPVWLPVALQSRDTGEWTEDPFYIHLTGDPGTWADNWSEVPGCTLPSRLHLRPGVA